MIVRRQLDTKLFREFTSQRLFRKFTGLDMSAREQPGIRKPMTHEEDLASPGINGHPHNAAMALISVCTQQTSVGKFLEKHRSLIRINQYAGD